LNGERRSFALLRPIVDATAQYAVRDRILEAYAQYEQALAADEYRPIRTTEPSGALSCARSAVLGTDDTCVFPEEKNRFQPVGAVQRSRAHLAHRELSTQLTLSP